ncbi:UDP-glucose 6-dehydrogenase [Bacillus sp. Soil745]|jgi:UDPglucose 6-dehydrogenase|uniref:UDP-glucose dehydrogenase family protein n=1 Tax=Peribacillus frigoritolerans TaxID=450367 RepID=UPI00070BCBE2|nr:UDP-glucose/GDP-mannose dehydrogenase family protein [Peribacillus frigoritolerans]KRF52230.1 UDP-glucose 6-dehydrogenase [Bacillus sp. Soil745]PAW27398.1 UDP-glucose 6-dehydrogenase [Peribacillus simplex]MCY9006008.1 UDP-glucose/GDP-mannose dehydrogenase family protein [Peribacillus frigoritolerans]MED3712299.1 UDP-glucose/GDP-mannose dehydrogenase family protein [Peribacillus frigoritolerans]MED3890413.1 UDP-glucose/GDP-mannose dehydrogenase family protein [Peribacillus frigoritolerans]
MKIAVLGTGYVGLSTGVCLSEIGHNVICIDTDEQKIKSLRQGISPIYEPGLENLLIQNAAAGRLLFTTSHREALNGAEIIIIAVGTPQMEDGGADLSYIVQAAKDIAANLVQSSVVVIKSTVPVGTNDFIKSIIEEHCNESVTFNMVSNPEFLRQGSAVMDTMQADRIIIGSENDEAAKKVQEMYRPLNVPFILTSIRSAEMIKYASNAFLATKISFINEVANLCGVVGADVKDVAKGMGKDKRIGEAFLQPGIGYGGSCFPKDVKALLHTANLNGVHFSLLKETVAINDFQQELLVTKAINRLGDLKGKKVAMLGLAFKPETDDMREAPSIKIARSLTKLGAEVVAYDPVAVDNAKNILGDTIRFASTVREAAVNADAVFIVTEWKEFRLLDLKTLMTTMRRPIVFDGRNCLEEDRIRACKKIEYYPIGRPAIVIGMT